MPVRGRVGRVTAPDAAVRDELARLCLLLLATVRPAPERLAIEAGAGAVEQLDRALAAGRG